MSVMSPEGGIVVIDAGILEIERFGGNELLNSLKIIATSRDS
jgi:hypothetical protein